MFPAPKNKAKGYDINAKKDNSHERIAHGLRGHMSALLAQEVYESARKEQQGYDDKYRFHFFQSGVFDLHIF